ncbi:TATA-box-binding protein [Thraustotheca clavata]|uniref:TATA-box-binding protein n=1 Tax=Thraustotheca clavata TaxID=74557 RepID=A0A1V9ZBU4_9STRA|nr:TATA-box-binding protein [Thraustotheca clavata]
MVGSGSLENKFVLSEVVAKTGKRAELIPKQNCVLLKLAQPRASAMLFPSGKLVVTGSNTEEGLKAAAQKCTQILKSLKFHVGLMHFRLENVIGRADAGFRILLEELALAYPDITTYEPELYPGLIYRMPRPKVHILIFVSGKVVFTGSKDARDLREACYQISPILEMFRDTKITNADHHVGQPFESATPRD